MAAARKFRLVIFVIVLLFSAFLVTGLRAQDATPEPTPTPVVVEPAPVPSGDLPSSVWTVIALIGGAYFAGVGTVVGFVRWLRSDDARSDSAERLVYSIPMDDRALNFLHGLFGLASEIGTYGQEITDGRLRSGEVVRALNGSISTSGGVTTIEIQEDTEVEEVPAAG